MANCVWAKCTRVFLLLVWLGLEDARNYFAAATTSRVAQRRAGNNFVDAAETLQQRIELGYITERMMTNGSRTVDRTTTRGDRSESYFMNRRVSHPEQIDLEARVSKGTYGLTREPVHRESVAFVARHAITQTCQMEGNSGDGTTASESIQTAPASRVSNLAIFQG